MKFAVKSKQITPSDLKDLDVKVTNIDFADLDDAQETLNELIHLEQNITKYGCSDPVMDLIGGTLESWSISIHDKEACLEGLGEKIANAAKAVWKFIAELIGKIIEIVKNFFNKHREVEKHVDEIDKNKIVITAGQESFTALESNFPANAIAFKDHPIELGMNRTMTQQLIDYLNFGWDSIITLGGAMLAYGLGPSEVTFRKAAEMEDEFSKKESKMSMIATNPYKEIGDGGQMEMVKRTMLEHGYMSYKDVCKQWAVAIEVQKKMDKSLEIINKMLADSDKALKKQEEWAEKGVTGYDIVEVKKIISNVRAEIKEVSGNAVSATHRLIAHLTKIDNVAKKFILHN